MPLLDTHRIADADVGYARLLYLSGFGVIRIAEVLQLGYRDVELLSRYHRWSRAVPCRRTAPIGYRRPVVVRCAHCAARYGEELGTHRACPHCGFAARDSRDPHQLSFAGLTA